MGLVTIFYCLRFETSLFFASYGSKGHGGGIRARLHMGLLHSIYFTLYIHTIRDYRQQSAVAILHTFQFTVTHSLGFSVFTSRILETDCNSSRGIGDIPPLAELWGGGSLISLRQHGYYQFVM
jgi:hypothetical protein